jgi:hypothetical protein
MVQPLSGLAQKNPLTVGLALLNPRLFKSVPSGDDSTIGRFCNQPAVRLRRLQGYGCLVVEIKRFVACLLEVTTKRRIASPREPHEAALDVRCRAMLAPSRPGKAATHRPPLPTFPPNRVVAGGGDPGRPRRGRLQHDWGRGEEWVETVT